jgi:Ala-tRNA(Pro) deacylase
MYRLSLLLIFLPLYLISRVQNPHKTILDFLTTNNITFHVFEHEPIRTCEESTQLIGLSLKQGAKSLLLKTENDFILVILPGDKKLHSKKLKKALQTKYLRFATPEEVKMVMGCEIGACYPFGNLLGIRMLADDALSDNDHISFSPGVHDKSVRVRWADYVQISQPELVSISI